MSLTKILKQWIKEQVRENTFLGRRIRAGVLLLGRWRGTPRVVGEFPDYPSWLQRNSPDAKDLEGERLAWEKSETPILSAVIPTFHPRIANLEQLIDSLRAQSYPSWQAVFVDDGTGDEDLTAWLEEQAVADPRIILISMAENRGISEATNEGIRAASGTLIAFVDHDDRLSPDAFSSVVRLFERDSSCQCVFTDEDKINAQSKRCEPYFKPGFNRALLYSRNYINHLTAVRRSALDEIGLLDSRRDGAQDYDLILRLLARFGRQSFKHSPSVAYSWRMPESGRNFSVVHQGRAWRAGRDALAAHLEAEGIRFERIEPAFGGGWRLRFALAAESRRLAVVIPTRDKGALLEECLASLEAACDPSMIELVIVDNGSCEPQALSLFKTLDRRFPGVQIVSAAGEFNYSRLVNIGVQASTSPIVLLLNNDISQRQGGWLEEMLGWAEMSWVGCVGARLEYPDGRLQHGGVVLGPAGAAGHYERFADPNDAGAFGHLQLPRGCAAVTAACLMVRRSLFEQVGGFDEVSFPVAFSDVDFCLRVSEAGFENVWTPYASLVHFEGASRGRESAKTESPDFRRARSALRQRWGHWIEGDPFVNPALDRRSEVVRLSRR
ncbi:glycosyltransferase family 2 protein [Maricaulis maris]|uniref:glycosyltransferase family 2 protein n=1 Tax=Maricaulis maris TaxID=74318 RepID=UPI003A95B924